MPGCHSTDFPAGQKPEAHKRLQRDHGGTACLILGFPFHPYTHSVWPKERLRKLLLQPFSGLG